MLYLVTMEKTAKLKVLVILAVAFILFRSALPVSSLSFELNRLAVSVSIVCIVFHEFLHAAGAVANHVSLRNISFHYNFEKGLASCRIYTPVKRRGMIQILVLPSAVLIIGSLVTYLISKNNVWLAVAFLNLLGGTVDYLAVAILLKLPSDCEVYEARDRGIGWVLLTSQEMDPLRMVSSIWTVQQGNEDSIARDPEKSTVSIVSVGILFLAILDLAQNAAALF